MEFDESRNIPDAGMSTADLVQAIHVELRNLASARMRRERPDHTLSPTALVHEMYLRLDREGHPWRSRSQFFKAAAEAMRRILIESAEAKSAAKRPTSRVRVSLGEAGASGSVLVDFDGISGVDLELLNQALEELCAVSPDIYWTVMLRFFAGLTAEQVAEVLEISERTVHRQWKVAKLFLFERCQRSVED